MNWTQKDIDHAKAKGLEVIDAKVVKPKKTAKRSPEKEAIELTLMMLKHKGTISDYVLEHRFHKVRRFKFDWAIIDMKIAVEFEGIMSKKSRHTTVTGYSKDCTKYNLAATEGWKVLRYTVLNYKNLEDDLKILIE